jgi:hypothetical protein
MATLNELVQVIARVEGIDPATVTLIARVVREDGLIATGGRGPSAAQMGSSDAANLLIAVNATKQAQDAAHIVRFYREMLPVEFLSEIAARPLHTETFGDAIERVIKAVAERELPASFMGLTVSEELQDSFRRGEYSMFITFNVSYFAARVRIQQSEAGTFAIMRREPDPQRDVSVTFTRIKTGEKLKPNKVVGVALQKFGGGWTDQMVETTIGRKTISAIANVLYGAPNRGEERGHARGTAAVERVGFRRLPRSRRSSE